MRSAHALCLFVHSTLPQNDLRVTPALPTAREPSRQKHNTIEGDLSAKFQVRNDTFCEAATNCQARISLLFLSLFFADSALAFLAGIGLANCRFGMRDEIRVTCHCHIRENAVAGNLRNAPITAAISPTRDALAALSSRSPVAGLRCRSSAGSN